MLPARSVWDDDQYDRFNDFHVALIIIILVIGFVLLACVTGGIWIAMAQRNKRARMPRNLNSYGPYASPQPVYQSPIIPAGGQEPFIDSPPPGKLMTSV